MLCACGCGSPTVIVKKTDRSGNRGEYRRYVVGHARKGKTVQPFKALCSKCGVVEILTKSRSAVCTACRTAKREQNYLAQKTRRANTGKHKAAYRDWSLRRLYGITSVEFDEMLIAQGGVCAVCGEASSRSTKTWSVDHNHATGVIRGILCNPCNRMLGYARDDSAVLERAIAYLASPPHSRLIPAHARRAAAPIGKQGQP